MRVGHLMPLMKKHQYELVIGLCTLFLAYIIVKAMKRFRSNFPPGPAGLPIVGYLPFLTKDLHLEFTNLSKKYGDVFSIRLGSHKIVLLNGVDVIKEAFKKDEFLGKPPNSVIEKIHPSSAFFGSNYDLWKEQRSFVLQSMKILGLDRTKIEEDVMDEIRHLIHVLRTLESQPVDLKAPLSASLSNNICALIFGKRFEYDDPKRRFIYKNLEEIFEYLTHAPLEVVFPWIKNIPFVSKLLETHRPRNAINNFKNFFQKELKERSKTYDPVNEGDWIDKFLEEIDMRKCKNANTTFTHDILLNNIIDFLGPGSETTTAFLLWFVLIVAAFPDVQKKIQKEIMVILGTEKPPEFMDMRNMTYTHSVILEIMRWKTVVPLVLMHCTLADTTVSGYNLPKGTSVLANIWAVHHDTRYWDEPEKFKPERFINKDGKSVLKPSFFIPFSLGKRICPGESMAYMQIFLYCTSILREFDIALPDGTKPNFNWKYGISYKPKSYLVRFIPRN